MVNLHKQTLGLSASYLFNWLLLAGTGRVPQQKRNISGVWELFYFSFFFVILDTIDYVNVIYIFVAYNTRHHPPKQTRNN